MTCVHMAISFEEPDYCLCETAATRRETTQCELEGYATRENSDLEYDEENDQWLDPDGDETIYFELDGFYVQEFYLVRVP